MDRNETGIFALGFVVGAVVGAAIALLYAPYPGWATKGIIRDKAGEIKEKAKESATGLKKMMERKIGHKEESS